MAKITADPKQGLVLEKDEMTTLTPGHASQFNVWWLLILSNFYWVNQELTALKGRVSALEAMGIGTPTGGTEGPSTGTAHITASFTATGGVAAGVMSFSATATTEAGQIASYEWSYGDGRTGTGKDVTVTYGNTGPWVVTLTVRDTSGNVKVVTRTITAPAATTAAAIQADFTFNRAFSFGFIAFGSGRSTAGPIAVYSWQFGTNGRVDTTDSYYNFINFYNAPTGLSVKASDFTGASVNMSKIIPASPNIAPTRAIAVKAPHMISRGSHLVVYGVPNGGNAHLQFIKKSGSSDGGWNGPYVAGPAAVVKSETAASTASYTLSSNTLDLSVSGWANLDITNIQYDQTRKITLHDGSQSPFIAIYVNDVTDGTADDKRTYPSVIVIVPAPFPEGVTANAEYPGGAPA